ncbi:LysR family transcriptional regulator [Dasania sp. GY-MA-18]|uniref:LysR family transcriptional regulator n=1 Tax=Dasania phycosphaerae TaxID=2950436 RepID=A0A9J6RM26_9GAMM|nr:MULTISPECIES: LysR family transcriptional regulator [Dasania]MCR8923139.1 LysR family transcriptional regulator [Dasania sp. GY-MA-18]MCZ0865571.1 LysR family transcriptional regulator [Dasania phycosphaerae]MCZ0869296.1 LysR family transcriptional regulator [Dasania phycosphaerae]
MKFTLKQLRYFLAVAEYGNVTTASEHLFVSQPAISNAINQLEEYFGVQLLIRHHAKGVSLTQAGSDLLTEATQLLRHAEDVQTHIKEHSQSLSGEINLGCFVTLAPLYIPKLINQFNELYPDVSFVLNEGNIEEISQSLLSGKTELAFVYDLGLGDRIKIHELAQLTPKVLLPADHELAKKKSLKFKDLEHETMVLLDLPHSREYFQSLFDGHGFKPQIRHRTGSYELVRSLVGNGYGYSIVNLSPQTNICYDGSSIVAIPLAENARPLSLVVARAANVRLPKRSEVFLEFCKENFHA